MNERRKMYESYWAFEAGKWTKINSVNALSPIKTQRRPRSFSCRLLLRSGQRTWTRMALMRGERTKTEQSTQVDLASLLATVTWVHKGVSSPSEYSICALIVCLCFQFTVRRTGQFFFWGRGAEPYVPEKFFDSARKTALLTCKITLTDSPHPVIISKNPGFRALCLAIRNEFRFFSFNKYFFFIFGCWLLPEK